LAAGAGLGALAISAVLNGYRAKRAERANPPAGHFLTIDGVRLHYVERGRGEPLVLLHGNGSMIEDFAASGLIDLAARHYRVIAFDRPGFGHSTRPRNVVWTPAAQANLIRKALGLLKVSRATILGHSWGASVAVALGLKHPHVVRALVLVSGYYYPTARGDVIALAGPAIPVIGDVLRYSISPSLGRLIWPRLMQKIFGPQKVPRKFEAFPKEMALRPSQIRASAAESALMIPDAVTLSSEYKKLTMPVVIIAGREDQLVDARRQSARLHRDVPRSRLLLVAGQGHMVHQTATADVLKAIDLAAQHGPEFTAAA
jgi:pimeloyl-ACP methyl ester carboxylesterase